MPNVMSIDLRANTERARDDVKATLSQAAQAAREFRNEMNSLRDAQLRARQAVVDTRAAFHQTQADIIRARDALRSYHTELTKATSEQQRLAAERTKLTASVAKAQQAYDAARKGMAFSGFSGAETTQSRAALESLNQLKTKLADVSAAHQSASGSVGYYRRQVNQTNADLGHLTATLAQQGTALRKNSDDSARLATTKGALSNRMNENRGVMQDLNTTLRDHERAIRADDRALRDLNDSGMAGALIGAALMDRALRTTWNTLKDLIVQSTLYAGRTVELQVALENVGRIQGWNVGQLRAMEEAIKSLGITTQDARQTLVQFAATGLNMSQAPQLARVAQDLAVVAGVDTSEEINRLVAGIETLQIRALRTAGVFVSLQGEMKKASQESRRSIQSFSEQEKQQILLNAVLDYGARATGTYDQAMTTASKQMRTMNRLTAEMHNAIGALFQGPFGLAIAAMSTFLRLVHAAPGAFVLAGAATTVFVGKVAYATLANSEWAGSFRAVAGSIVDATRATLGLSAAQGRLTATTHASAGANVANAATNRAGMLASGLGIGGVGGAIPAGAAARSTLGLSAGAGAGTAAAGGLSATGWGLIALAVGSAAYAVLKYATAEKEATFANQENLRIMQRQIQVNSEDAKTFRERANAIRQTGKEMMMSDEQRKDASREEAMALLRLDPLQRQAAENDRNRAAQLDALASGLDKVNIKLREQLRDLNRMTVANLDDSTVQIETLLKRAEEGRARNTAYNKNSPSAFMFEWGESIAGLIGLGNGSYGGDVGTQRVMEDSAKAQGAIAARRDALEGLAVQEAEIRLRTKQSTDAILAQEFGVRKGTKAYDEIQVAIANHARKQEEANGVVREAQDLYNQMTRNLEQLKLAQFDVSVTTEGMSQQQGNIAAILKGGIELGMDWKTVVAGMASGIRAFDDDIVKISTSQADYNQRVAALSPEMQQAIYDTNASAKAYERYGESAGKAAKKLIELKNNIRDNIREMAALQAATGEMSNLQGVEYAVNRELAARRRLQEGELERYGDTRTQPVTAEEVDEATRRIQGQLDTIKAAREAIFRLERMEVEGMIQQFQVQQQQNELLNEETRQRERHMTVATTFLRMQQDRIAQEKQLTAEIAARFRMETEEGENRRRGVGRDRIAYLEAVAARQKSQLELRAGMEALRADVQVRRDLQPGAGGLQIGDFSYQKRFDTIEPTKQDLAVINLMTQEQKQLHAIEQNTFNTVENTAVIAEKMSGGLVGGVASHHAGVTLPTGSSGELSATDSQRVLMALRQAIIGGESNGVFGVVNRGTVNPRTGRSDPALGYGQVLTSNLPSWLKEAGFNPNTSSRDYLNNPAMQVKVIDAQLRKYLQQVLPMAGGNIDTAVRMVSAGWYGGPDDFKNYDRPGGGGVHGGVQYPGFREYTNDKLRRFHKAMGSDTGELHIDPEETRRRNEVNQRIMRGYKIPTPTEREIAGAKGTMNDPDTVVSIYTDLIDLTAKFNTEVDNTIALEKERLQQIIQTGAADVQTQHAIISGIQARYAEATRTYRELEAQRYADASGFQESEENKQRIFMGVELARRKAAEDTKNRIIEVQREIEEVNIGSADRIRLAYLESAKAQARSSEDALTRIAQNLPKLDAAAQLNMDEVSASISDWLVQQKSVSQVYASSITGFMENTFGAIDNLLNRATARLGIFGSFISDLFGGLLKAGLTQVFSGILGQPGGAVDTVRNIVGGQAAPQAQPLTNALPEEISSLINGSKTVGRMDIQSAGQVIINATGAAAGGAAIANSFGQGGVPAVVAQAMQRGLIPTGAQSGGGVFNIGSNGVVMNSAGQPIGALPNVNNGVGLGSGGRGTPFMLGGSGMFGLPMVGPGGTAPFNPNAGTGLGSSMGSGALSSIIAMAGGAQAPGQASPTQAPRTGPGGILNSILNVGRGFFGQQLPGGGFGGIFGTAATGGTFGFGNSAFAQMLPLLGMSLGGQLGGSSRLGGIMGMAGGALAGIGLMGAPAILGAGGALSGLGFLAPLFSNPLTAIAGGALLIGAVLLGRNSRRRQEERQRTQILGDAKAQLQKILRDVQRDRMDGESGIAAAEGIRQQYLEAVGQLKDRKTRDIAIATVRELDYFISQIRQAAATQSRRRELDSLLVPEFAGGGIASSAFSYGQGRGGTVSGVDMGGDTVLARLRPREMVLNQHQQRRAMATYGGDVFHNIGVPGLAGGGYPTQSPSLTSKSSGKKGDTYVYLVADENYAQDLVRKTGGVVLNMSATSLKNQDGPLYREIKKLR